MIGDKHYVPILKGKRAEFDALRSLDAPTAAKLTPLIEAMPVPWDFENDQPAKGLEEHLQSLGDALSRAWRQDFPLFVDPLWVPGEATLANGGLAITYILDQARDHGVRVVPVTSIGRSDVYQRAVADAIARDKLGVCIRLGPEDLDDPGALQPPLDGLMRTLAVTAADANLLIDLRSIAEGMAGALALSVASIVGSLPYVRQWRSLIVAASAFPRTLSVVAANSTEAIERTEWLLWRRLRQRADALPRLPVFSDYVIEHPDLAEDIDPRFLRISAQLRYTSDEEWLILKGRNVRDFGYDQFRSLCSTLVGRTEYRGRSFSWGDTYIDDCAHNNDGPGNPTKWRQAGTSHHLAVVIHQIANLA